MGHAAWRDHPGVLTCLSRAFEPNTSVPSERRGSPQKVRGDRIDAGAWGRVVEEKVSLPVPSSMVRGEASHC